MSARSRITTAAACAALVVGVVATAPAGANASRVARNATQARASAGVHATTPVTDYGAGYFSYPASGDVASASVTFTMPTFTCRSQSDDEWLSPGVWIYNATSSLSQFSGVEFNCNAGALFQGDVICVDSYAACDDTLVVHPGDRVVAAISESSVQTAASVHDLTTGQQVRVTGAPVTNDETVFLGDEGPLRVSGGSVTQVPTFSKVVFSKAQVDGLYLADWSPIGYNLKTSHVVQEKVGALSGDGDGFKTTFEHN